MHKWHQNVMTPSSSQNVEDLGYEYNSMSWLFQTAITVTKATTTASQLHSFNHRKSKQTHIHCSQQASQVQQLHKPRSWSFEIATAETKGCNNSIYKKLSAPHLQSQTNPGKHRFSVANTLLQCNSYSLGLGSGSSAAFTATNTTLGAFEFGR